MSEFERENRYIVVKRKHLDRATTVNVECMLGNAGVTPIECLVIEPDWPEYELAWSLIEARCTGRFADVNDVDQTAYDQLYSITNINDMWESEARAILVSHRLASTAELRAEIEQLRGALLKTSQAVGATLSDSVSTQFLVEGVPQEVRLKIKELHKQRGLAVSAAKGRKAKNTRQKIAQPAHL